MYIWPFDVSPDEPPVAAPIAEGLPLKEKLPNRRIVLPVDPDYDASRKTFNPRFDDVHPWVIAFCGTDRDLRACLEGVRKYQTPFCIRSGGHSFAGYSSIDAGVVIDVAGLNNLRFDADRLEVTVGPGCRMGDLQAALGERKLRLPLGGSPVGVGGFMQGGGFGDISRTFGMNSDSVLAVWIMLADGRVVQASESVNHDLWWAVRGGTGGNFGVVVDVRYRLHRAAAPVQDWSFAWPIERPSDTTRAAKVLVTLQDEVLARAGPELNAGADLRYLPESNLGIPRILRLLVYGKYFGNRSDMDALLRPLADIGGQRTFNALQVERLPVLRQSRFVSELAERHWQTLVDDFAAHANVYSTLTMNAWGGAIASYPRENSAFIHRSAAFNMYVTGFWKGPADEQRMRLYLQRWRDFIAPYWNNGIYQNFADPECPDYRSNYWADAFPALLAVKTKYDPEGVFRFPQAIEGASLPVTWPPKVVQWLGKPIEI